MWFQIRRVHQLKTSYSTSVRKLGSRNKTVSEERIDVWSVNVLHPTAVSRAIFTSVTSLLYLISLRSATIWLFPVARYHKQCNMEAFVAFVGPYHSGRGFHAIYASRSFYFRCLWFAKRWRPFYSIVVLESQVESTSDDLYRTGAI